MKLSDNVEQFLHFTLLGLVLGFLLGPIAVLLNLIRELTDWKWMPWPFKGQWPPNSDRFVEVEGYLPEERVEDLRRDLIYTFTGYALGQALQLGGMLVWFLR